MAEDRDANIIKAELLISFVLRYGVLLCAFVIGVGVVIGFVHPHSDPSKVSQIESLIQTKVLNDYHPTSSVVELYHGMMNHDPELFITAGLLLLIGLPIARVALTIFVFLFERDWAFVLITAIVFTVLMSGIIMGRAL